MEELKPVRCGCGGEAQVFLPFTNNSVYMIECKKCGICTSAYETETEAITAWNLAMGALLPEGDPQKNVGCKCSNTTERTAKVDADWGLAICCACKKRVFPSEKYCSYCGARLEWE